MLNRFDRYNFKKLFPRGKKTQKPNIKILCVTVLKTRGNVLVIRQTANLYPLDLCLAQLHTL